MGVALGHHRTFMPKEHPDGRQWHTVHGKVTSKGIRSRVMYLQLGDNPCGPKKPGKMPSLHHWMRGLCHGTPARVLPASADRARVGVPPALLALAKRSRRPWPSESPIQVDPALTLPRIQAVSGPRIGSQPLPGATG
jgi:hypothetical protein